MGTTSPVLVFLIGPNEVPARLSSYLDAAELISDRWSRWEQEGNTEDFLQSDSRNWWHEHLLYLMCKEYGIQGLEFATQEIALLTSRELLAAEAGLVELFRRFEGRHLPEKHDMFENYADVLGSQFFSAFEAAQPAAKINQYDAGFDAAVSFCAFLKSVKHMIETALQQDKWLLFVMPAFNELNGSFNDGAA